LKCGNKISLMSSSKEEFLSRLIMFYPSDSQEISKEIIDILKNCQDMRTSLLESKDRILAVNKGALLREFKQSTAIALTQAADSLIQEACKS